MSTHKAAILTAAGTPLTVQDRLTPQPGPNDILVQIKAVALNPVDYVQRDLGMAVYSFPTVLGSDSAGIVVKVGSAVKDPPAVGSRVIAFTSGYYQNSNPDYGVFQQYALAPSEGVIQLPDSFSFEQGAVFPVTFLTGMSGFWKVGVPLTTRYKPEDKQCVLVWGAGSAVGASAVQVAKVLGFRVYATASGHNHEAIKKLGADVVFDYKEKDVISQIGDTVKRDGYVLDLVYCATPDCLQQSLDVLKITKGPGVAKVSFAPPLLPGAPSADDVEVSFISLPEGAEERNEHIRYCFHDWLSPKLQSGAIVPSPAIRVAKGGLQGINDALDDLKGGVSYTKIVVPL